MVHTQSKKVILGSIFSLSLITVFVQASELQRAHPVAFFAGASAAARTSEVLYAKLMKKEALPGNPVIGYQNEALPVSAKSVDVTVQVSEGVSATVQYNVVDAIENRKGLRAGYFTVGVAYPSTDCVKDRILGLRPYVHGVTVGNVLKTTAAVYVLNRGLKALGR
jgi:hypothetical protein